MMANENTQGPAVVDQFWEEVGPRRMIPTQKLNDLDIGDGRTWEIGHSLSGLDLVVTTDLKYPSEEEAQGRPHKVFVLRGAPLVAQLGHRLLDREPEEDEGGMVTCECGADVDTSFRGECDACGRAVA